MKKVICFLLSVLFLAAWMPGVYAEDAATVSAGDVSGHAGETVTVPVQMTGNPGLVAMRLYVQYDAAKLRLVGAQDKGLFGTGNDYFGNNLAENPYTLLWEDALTRTDYTGSGLLAELQFRIIDDVQPGIVGIALTMDQGSTFNVNLQNVGVTLQSGSVQITEKATYTVSFMADGQICQSAQVHAGDVIQKPADPVKAGYTFTGWTPEVPATMPAQDMTFTAVFEKIPETPAAVNGVALDDLTLYYKDGGALPMKVETQGEPNYRVTYTVINPKILSVGEDGTVKTLHWGKTDVKVTVTDENGNSFTDTCTVQVKCRVWQWLIIIFLFGWIWY